MKTFNDISARTCPLIRQSFNTRIVACILLCSAVLLPATQTLGGFPPDPCDSDPCGSGCDGALHPCCINEGDPCCDAGPPRPWQAFIPAGPFSVVTAWSGNLSTAVPIVGFSGRGPNISIVLFHDSACVQSVPSNGFGVDLGPGWTISYTGHIEGGPPSSTATVVKDDGTRNRYQLDSGDYVAPPGVFDTLERDAVSGYWTLTRKGQSKRIFDDDGKLIKIYDSTSNGLSVNWETGYSIDRIDYIEDDSGRQIEYIYAANTDRLIEIKDPANKASSTAFSRSARSWDLHYVDSNGLKLTEIRDPVYGSTAPIIFGYNDDGRITAVTDKYLVADRAGKTFTFAYNYHDQVQYMNDPSELNNSAQILIYGNSLGSSDIFTIYTDRRGKSWLYTSLADTSLKEIKNPLAHVMTYERDNDFNITRFTDALSHEWTYVYDDRGNLKSVTDPLTNVTSNSFDELNNLTSILDAEGEEWQFFYDEALDPTLLTSIVEPDDGVNGQAETLLAYYDTNGAEDGKSNGALAAVMDPNGAITVYLYDQFGHQRYLAEGAEVVGAARSRGDLRFDNPENIEIHPEPVGFGSDNDDAGNMRGSSDTGGDNGSGNFDAIRRIYFSNCVYTLCHPTHPCAGLVDPGLEPLPRAPWADLIADFGGKLTGWLGEGDITYSPQNQVLNMENGIGEPNSGTTSRETTQTFDAFGRSLSRTVDSDIGGNYQRTQSFSYDDSTGQSVVTVDGEDYTYAVDDAGRLASITGPDSTATYTYYDNNQIKKITYGNGADVEYEYLDNGWLEKITHDPGRAGIKTLEYFYDAVGRITATEEKGFEGLVATQHDYDYDARGRLTHEERFAFGAVGVYEITYTYDNGGNRKSKRTQISGQDDVAVDYFYDVDPNVDGRDLYGSFNNRLMYFITSNGTEPLETTWYGYTGDGNVARIITKKEGEDLYTGTRFEYDAAGRLWRASGDQWQNNWHFVSDGGNPWGYLLTDDAMTIDDARAFAESIDADLAQVADPAFLDVVSQVFAPKDGTEVTYWLGGYQVETDFVPGVECGGSGQYACCTPGTNCTVDSTWCWWNWEDYDDEDPLVNWIPEDKKCPAGSACFIEDIYTFITRYEGGWLSGEPDDGDCVENGAEQNMVITFNVNGNVTSHGFSDVNSNGMRRALISRSFPNPNITGKGIVDEDATYERLWAREFRYDGPRQRYVVRELNPETLYAGSSESWTEYVGNAPMADYYPAGGGNNTEVMRYNPGISETDIASNGTEYLHNDHLASTWFSTDDPASGPLTISRRAVRTAFGEIVYVESPVDTRYGYAGGWGYETHDIDSNGDGDGIPDNSLNAPPTIGFPFMHVGARYYDPASGRFLQRDPIGIQGGLNVYGYIGNSPINGVDPTGKWTVSVGAGGGAVGGIFPSGLGGGVEVGLEVGWVDGGPYLGVYGEGTVYGGPAVGFWGDFNVTASNCSKSADLSGLNKSLLCLLGSSSVSLTESGVGTGAGIGPSLGGGAALGMGARGAAGVTIPVPSVDVSDGPFWENFCHALMQDVPTRFRPF